MFFSLFLLTIAQFFTKIGTLPFFFTKVFFAGYFKLKIAIKRQYRRLTTFFLSVKNSMRLFFKGVKYVFFRKSVLYGFLSAVLVFSSFQFGFQAGETAHQKRLTQLQQSAVVKILDRNGVLLYTYRNFQDSSSPENYKRAPSFVDYTLQKLKHDYGDALFLYGGTVRTTLDLHLQNEVQSKVIETVMNNQPAADASALVLNSKTKEVLALVGSIHYFDNPGLSDKPRVVENKDFTNVNPVLEVTNYQNEVLYKKTKQNARFTAENFNKNALWTPEEIKTTHVGSIAIQTYLNKNDVTNYISRNKDNIN
jgi:hypothetical protein